MNPVCAVAGYFPALPRTPAPHGAGAPIPDREAERDGHHGPRGGYVGQGTGYKGCVEHRTDGSFIYAVSP